MIPLAALPGDRAVFPFRIRLPPQDAKATYGSQAKEKTEGARRAKLHRRHEEQRVVPQAEFSLRREIDYIVARAAERDGRCVCIGPLVLFSTQSGDAWILDPSDQLALCLARDGDPEPVNIVENSSNYSIEWAGTYSIDGEAFTMAERETGRVRTVTGYPIQEILAAIARSRA